MKKIIMIAFLLLCFINANAQTNTNTIDFYQYFINGSKKIQKQNVKKDEASNFQINNINLLKYEVEVKSKTYELEQSSSKTLDLLFNGSEKESEKSETKNENAKQQVQNGIKEMEEVKQLLDRTDTTIPKINTLMKNCKHYQSQFDIVTKINTYILQLKDIQNQTDTFVSIAKKISSLNISNRMNLNKTIDSIKIEYEDLYENYEELEDKYKDKPDILKKIKKASNYLKASKEKFDEIDFDVLFNTLYELKENLENLLNFKYNFPLNSKGDFTEYYITIKNKKDKSIFYEFSPFTSHMNGGLNIFFSSGVTKSFGKYAQTNVYYLEDTLLRKEKNMSKINIGFGVFTHFARKGTKWYDHLAYTIGVSPNFQRTEILNSTLYNGISGFWGYDKKFIVTAGCSLIPISILKNDSIKVDKVFPKNMDINAITQKEHLPSFFISLSVSFNKIKLMN